MFPSLSSSSKEPSVLEKEAKKLVASLSVGEESLEQLSGQVSHYKSVLAQTETMLTSLQTSVEAAESDWKLKLDIANRWVDLGVWWPFLIHSVFQGAYRLETWKL